MCVRKPWSWPTIPLLNAYRTRIQPPVCAAASPAAASMSTATHGPRPCRYRVRRERPVRGLRGTDLVSEERGERARAEDQLGRQPALEDPALVEDDGAVGELDRREALRRDEHGPAFERGA